MTLEEFNKAVQECSQKAHLFFATDFDIKQVRSISLRMDDDGVLSIVCHASRMKNRVPSEDAKFTEEALKAFRELINRVPDLKENFEEFDGFFVHWDQVTDTISKAGKNYQHYSESPFELITKLIDERDDLRERLDRRNGRKKKTPKEPTA